MTAAVFDCVVLLQAAANPHGPAGACLALVEAGEVHLFVSPAILDEARSVLARPATRRQFPLLTEEKTDRFLLKVTTLSTLVHDVPRAMEFPRDPADEPYLNLAIAVKAPFLVTRDTHMLPLMQDAAFTSTYPALSIVDPVAFLTHNRAQKS